MQIVFDAHKIKIPRETNGIEDLKYIKDLRAERDVRYITGYKTGYNLNDIFICDILYVSTPYLTKVKCKSIITDTLI